MLFWFSCNVNNICDTLPSERKDTPIRKGQEQQRWLLLFLMKPQGHNCTCRGVCGQQTHGEERDRHRRRFDGHHVFFCDSELSCCLSSGGVQEGCGVVSVAALFYKPHRRKKLSHCQGSWNLHKATEFPQRKTVEDAKSVHRTVNKSLIIYVIVV